MSGFKYFEHGGCPVCQGLRKDCRESERTGLVFCRETSVNPPNYIYRGEDSLGFGLWQESSSAEEFNQQIQEERDRKRREYLEAEARRKQQRVDGQLPAIERDKAYGKVVQRLKLNKRHLQALLERGLTPEQIERDGYRSVVAWQRVGKDLPQNLPGVLNNGCLNIHTNGIICPIKNENGLIVGFQARLDGNEDGRYRWLTSATKNNPDGATPHLDGELPLAIVEPDEFLEDSSSIWLTEGTMIKPHLCSHKLNVPVIGAAGGQFNKSPKIAKASVDYLSSKYGTKLLTFAIDAGDASNTSGVPERILSQIKFFEELGYTCRISWWGQLSKEHDDDIDELSDISVITYISPQEFWAIVEEHRATKSQATVNKEDKDWAWSAWLKSRKYTPHKVVNQDKFDFGSIPDSNAIIAGKSGLGSGKTEALIKVMQASNRGAMIIGYRNNLLYQTISRASENGVMIYHIQEDDADLMLLDDENTSALCLDSIHRVDGYFIGKDIYLDETCSVLLHGCNGGTLGDNQAKAIRILNHAIQESNRVFLLDGNLSDMQVNFISKLAPEKEVIKIENQRKIPPHNIYFVEGVELENELNETSDKQKVTKAGVKVRGRDRSALINFLAQDDVIPFVACDSINQTKILSKILESAGKTGYVLNAETATEPWAKEFIFNPDAFLLENKDKIQYFIVSPTAESGVSITVKDFFTHKFSFFVGVLGTNSQHQIMFRLRDNTIPHYVFCPKFSNIKDSSNPQNYALNKFQQILNDKLNLSAKFAAEDSDNYESASLIISQAFARSDDKWFDYTCDLGRLENYEKDNLRKCLIHVLTEAGHNVEIVQWEVDHESKAKESEAKEAVRRELSEELFTAQEFESVEIAKEIAKSNPSKLIQRQIEKTFLLDRLPGIKESEVWNSDFIYNHYVKDRDYINKQQRFYMLQNFKTSKKRHEADWFYKATQEDFFKASMRRTSHLTNWALHELNILQFLQGEWHKDSPEVIEVINKARDIKEIELALRIKPGVATSDGKERIPFISQLLNMVGIKFSSTNRKIIDGVRKRVYVVSEQTLNDPIRVAALKCIEQKQTAWMESKKSKIDWTIEKPQQPTPEQVTATPTIAETAAVQLRAATSWEQVTLSQDEIDAGWQLLTVDEQNYLHQLFQQYRQSQEQHQQNNNNVIKQAIQAQASVKEVGFGGKHFRTYQIIRLLENGIALVRRCFGDKSECEIALELLII